MKNIIKSTILTMSATVLLSSCASLYINSGKKAYNDLDYQEAITLLEKGLAKKDNEEGRRMLAESYMMVNDFENAKAQFEKTSLYTNNTDKDRILQGQALMSTGQYDQAKTIFEGIISRDPQNQMAKSLLASCKRLNEMKADSLMYSVTPVNIPGNNPVYSGLPYDGGLLISSTKNDGDKDPYTKNSFTDLYFTKNDGNGWSNPTLVEGLNSKYHDAVAAVSPNGTTAIFTRSFQLKNQLGGNDQNEATNQLYFSRKGADGKWEPAQMLPFCDVKYQFMHPTFSPDGNTLYFTSDMPGTLGGTDIWMSKYTDGAWGIPTNLGGDINTKGDEAFPTIKDENTLYFSSDTHSTLGGLDIVYSEKNDGKWQMPKHLSYPINSNRDDFSAYFTADKSGYFSSDRTGSDRIYSFEIIDPTIVVEGMVLGKQSPPLGGVKVTIMDLTTGEEKVVFTDGEGKFSAELEPNREYKIKSELDGFFTTTEDISTKGVTSDKTYTQVIEMPEVYVTESNPKSDGTKGGDKKPKDQKGVYPVHDIHWDYNKWDIRPDAIPYLEALVKLFRENQNLKFEISSHCDSRGSYEYNDDLSAKRAKAVVDYLISKGVPRSIMVSKGYGERKLLNGCSDGVMCTEEQHQENRRTEFIVTDKKK
jgi:outer membrane protein OmpA-like peptidoglycan-associated protein